MARASPVNPSSFPFEVVEVSIEERLGRGAYGFVCRAKCDRLPAAAKLLHSTLFEFIDSKEIASIEEKFTQECEILEKIVHPNIVQFIGVVRILDGPYQRKLALLTELMDDSLTHFITLKSDSGEEIPYHVEIDLAYDIILAISFLHSRGIIHRDLSSNNILIQGGRRAKVTDFGMAKFHDVKNRLAKAMTKCPGTPVFMPPEALWEPPEYSKELDVFSWGVVCFHILSKTYPNPTQMHTREVDSKGRPIAVWVPEKIRRAASIESVPEDHPLYSEADESIRDVAAERPSSDTLCDRLERLKHSERYLADLRKPSLAFQLEQELQHRDAYISQLEEQVSQLVAEKEEASADPQQGSSIPCEIKELESENESLKSKINSLTAEVNALKKQTSIVSQNETSGALLGDSKGPFNWECGHTSAPVHFTRGSAVAHGNVAYLSRPHSSVVHCYNMTQKCWTEISNCPVEDFTLTVFGEKLLAVGGVKLCTKGLKPKPVKEVHCFDLVSLGETEWDSRAIPSMFTPRVYPAVVGHGNLLLVAGGRKERGEGGEPLVSVEIYSTESNAWYSAYNLPKPLYHPRAVVCEDDVYLIGSTKSEGSTSNISDVVYHSSQSEKIEVIGCAKSESKLHDIIYHISLPFLYKWSNRTFVPVSIRAVWTHLSSPTLHATPVSINGNLYLVGGARAEHNGHLEPSNDVLKLKKEQGKFSVSLMPRPRGQCVAATVSGHKVMVVGGCADRAMDCGVSTDI